VTDAHLVLGTLDARRRFGGTVALDREAARRAVRERVAEPLGLGVEAAAAAILRIANANMADALRVVSVARGHDPRGFALVALGGAGPMHACAIADELGIPRVVVPRHPGVTAALGLLLADVRHDLRRSWIRPTAEVDPAELDAAVAALEADARERLAVSGHGGDAVECELDMRYRGQAYNLTVPLAPRPVTAATLAAADAAFRAAHARAYDYTPSLEETEIVTVRVRATGAVAPPDLSGAAGADGRPPAEREVWEDGGAVTYAVLERDALAPGTPIEGPAIVEQEDATVVVPAGWAGVPGAAGALVLTREEAA
jgi:N-methylhydantoinase A